MPFAPSFSAKPTSPKIGAPTGFAFDLTLPQSNDPSAIEEADLKKAVVTLPEGLTLNPSAADGLGSCSSAQIGLAGTSFPEPNPIHFNESEPSCPEDSRIGTLTIKTPLLEEPLQGSVYLAAQNDNPFHSLLAIYLVAKGPGVLLKLPGLVQADPSTGRLTATFDHNPQLPFSDLHLEFKNGPRAPLVNPGSCGTFTTTSDMTPWSAPFTPDATPSSSFQITEGCGPHGFAPSFVAGTTSNQAAGFSPFTVTIARTDADQQLSGIQVQTPPGLLGTLKSVPLCGEAQANAGTCPAVSQIGHTTVSAGAGSNPISLPVAGQPPNPVFLTTGYRGAPFGLSVVVPAIAGPFNLGTVVVRAAISVDPRTAQITVTSDPLPRILDGIPLQVRSVNVTVDRPNFTFNPTNCEALRVDGTMASSEGATASVSSRFQAANCATLPFHPTFKVSTGSDVSRTNGVSLKVHVTSGAGQANIRSVKVKLPKQLASRLSTLQQACPEGVFAQNPASCPAGSRVGAARAITPILSNPLIGPVFFVSHGGAKFPELVIVLQGEGVTIELSGETFIAEKTGITSSTFRSVPDAPISSFELSLPTGPHSVLGSKANLCKTRLLMPTLITGQNGAVVKQTTRIGVNGCATRKAKSARRRG